MGLGEVCDLFPASPSPRISAWWRPGPSRTCPPVTGSPGSAPYAASSFNKGTVSRDYSPLDGPVQQGQGLQALLFPQLLPLIKGQ